MKKTVLFGLISIAAFVCVVTVYATQNGIRYYADRAVKLEVLPKDEKGSILSDGSSHEEYAQTASQTTVAEDSEEALPSDIVTPIDFTTSKKIGEKMPDFTFHLTGNNVKRADEDSAWRGVNEIDSITITDHRGTLVQRIGNIITGNRASEDMYGLTFDDWNFDGYIDIGLAAYPGGSMGNYPHYYWLWDSCLNQFVENVELMGISEGYSIYIDTAENKLECFTRHGASGYTLTYFKYINDKFVFEYSMNYTLAQSPDENGKYVTRIITTELVDGEEMSTEEYCDKTIEELAYERLSRLSN